MNPLANGAMHRLACEAVSFDNFGVSFVNLSSSSKEIDRGSFGLCVWFSYAIRYIFLKNL